DAGSEYAAASIETIKKSVADDIKAVILEITGVIETKPLPTSVATEIKEGAVKAESPPKEELIINEFSSYIDNVVREKKTSTPKPRVMISGSGAALESGETGRIRRTASFLYDLFILKPAAMAVRHKYKLAVVMAFFIFAFFYVFPEFILGKGSFVELSQGGQQSVESYLNSNGYKLNKSGNGVPLVYEHRYWTSSIPFFEGYFGKTIMFSAYEVNLKNTDIFEAVVKFDKYGEVSKLDKINNISETSSADENDLIIMKNSFAYLSSADSGMKILTIEEGDGSNKRQFLFKNLVNINKIENSALALNLIKVETNRGKNKTNVSLNVDSGTIDPPDFPVEYLPNIEADEPMIPKIVEKVRSLNFVGPEKIAKLEDCYYQTSDFFKRKFYGSNEEEETVSSPEAKNEEIVVSGEPMFENIKTIEAVKTVADAIAFKFKEFRDFNVLFFKNITGFDEKNSKAFFTANAGVTASSGTEEVKLVQAAVTASVDLAELTMPANITPIYKKSIMKNEGVWSTEETPILNGKNYVFKTRIRVDPKRSFAIMHIASIDISKVDMKLVPGTEEPVSTIGLKGKGMIPGDAETYQNLICAFNGGFRSKHGKWGFISEGVTYLSPVNGIATIAVDSKGAIKIGTWGSSGLDTKENYVYLRQNLPPILEKGKLNEDNKYWGASVDNKTNIWRSAIGITKDGKRLVYGAGNSLTFDTLAKGMEMAGCDYAMQLDINEYHTYFHLYKLNGADKKGNLKLKVTRLTDEMANETQRCVKPYTRDFFYLTWKNNAIQTAAVK
ncbi:MAG TPA: phosphodiester glycosidase family protein, partial [Candidatus Wallbacteria bacterium]|nr:phosphodiester glycosidase family protein [Candidatus Wallbacteria bacterium]